MSMQQTQPLSIRTATAADLPVLVQMLADDMLGRAREAITEPLPQAYHDAFAAIDADANNELIVATMADAVVASLQITYTPSLSYQGRWRATLESVRTRADLRGHGIGTVLVRAAVERARARGCGTVQLSTNRKRVDARRFYERLGFTATHDGMKLFLQDDQ